MGKGKYTFASELNSDTVKVLPLFIRIFCIAWYIYSDVKDHLRTKKHKESFEPAVGSKTATQKATFAYHTAVHDHSTKLADRTSKFSEMCFEQKYPLAKTKCEAII